MRLFFILSYFQRTESVVVSEFKRVKRVKVAKYAKKQSLSNYISSFMR